MNNFPISIPIISSTPASGNRPDVNHQQIYVRDGILYAQSSDGTEYEIKPTSKRFIEYPTQNDTIHLDLNYETTYNIVTTATLNNTITPNYVVDDIPTNILPIYGEKKVIIKNASSNLFNVTLPTSRYVNGSDIRNYYKNILQISLDVGYTCEIHYLFTKNDIRIVLQEFFYNVTT